MDEQEFGQPPLWSCAGEYLASIRDIPDEILDAAPEGMPEELWLAAMGSEAADQPDPLADPPGVVLAGSLADVVDAYVGDGQVVVRIAGFERQASWAAAGQARAIAELATRRVEAGGPGELAFYVDEVALALTCSRCAARAKLHTALDLVDRLPATLAALAAGRICAVRARIIAEGSRALSDVDAALVQDEVLAAAEGLTPSKLRTWVALAVAAVDPRDADEQHEAACASRAVKQYPREQGMTGIWALLPADHAAAVWAAVNTHAEASREVGDDRTADQRRADSLSDLMIAYLTGTCPAELPDPGSELTAASSRHRAPDRDRDRGADPDPDPDPGNETDPGGGSGGERESRQNGDSNSDPDTDPAASAGRPGCSAVGGHLAPAGAVLVPGPDQDLRGLAARTQHRTVGPGRLWTFADRRRPAIDRRRHLAAPRLRPTQRGPAGRRHRHPRPTAAVAPHVLVRDGGCTQPICGNPRVDLDHNVPHPDGPTSAANLRSRCRHDHHLKQHPQWTARVRPDGRIH